MRRRLAISALVLAAGGLGVVAPAGAASSSQQTKFINTVRFLDPTAKGVSNKEILKLGNGVCSDLKSGTSVKKLAGILRSEKADLVAATTDLCPSYKAEVAAYYAAAAKAALAASTRPVRGTPATLGAGNFAGGQDVKVGLYNVTPGAGQSGNFIVTGTDDYDEILGDTTDGGVPEVRAQISNGDKIQISGLSQVVFTPVATPYVTTHTPVTLYAGTWTVGQDLGAGRYVATPGAGQSGNFIITSEGVDEILGDESDGGVPNVTTTVQKGDVIEISGLSQVTMTPA